MKRYAFTLVELLIVLAVISILAAILLPVFAIVRQKKTQTSCLSNVKQMGTALMLYTQDFDDRLPNTYFGANGAPTSPKWMDVIYPYIKNEQIFNCPGDLFARDKLGRYTLPYIYYKRRKKDNYGSYAANAAYWGFDLNPNAVAHGPRLRYMVEVRAPSTTAWATDSDYPGANANFHWQTIVDNPLPSRNNPPGLPSQGHTGGIVGRHLGTANVLFLDQHAKSMSINSLTKRNLKTWAYSYFTIEDD